MGRDCVETVLNCVQTSPAVIGGPLMIITHTHLAQLVLGNILKMILLEDKLINLFLNYFFMYT